MNYFSTRNKSLKFSFKDIFLRGLAPGGGLFLPTKIKKYNKEDLNTSAEQKIVGLLREIYKPNMFKPDNDIKNNIWFSINLEDLKEATGEQFNEFVIFLEDNQVKSPIPKKISIDVPNNHLKYAITWYAISISIIFYYLYFRRKK